MSFRIHDLCLLVLTAALASCSGCGDGGGNKDTDTGTDTGLDTDTSWDGGPLTNCDDALPHADMACVKGGKYLMGCMPYDLQCKQNETPMVEVTLSPFWIDEKEATLEEIIPFLNWLLSQEDYILDGYIYRVSDHTAIWVVGQDGGFAPIGALSEDELIYSVGEETCGTRSPEAAAGGLSWEGAKLYCEYRGKRLPTEAEWEAAARGQTKWIYPCAWEHKACWYGKYDCCDPEPSCPGVCQDPCCIPFASSQTASCESPNGVVNMYGNAAEWVLDHKDQDHSWCADGCTDPAPRLGEVAIMKGGSIALDADMTRISARYTKNDNTPINYSGVRCVSSSVDFVLPDGGVVWGE